MTLSVAVRWVLACLIALVLALPDYAQADEADRDDDLADVAGDFIRYAIDDLSKMTEELDDRYAIEEQTPRPREPETPA